MPVKKIVIDKANRLYQLPPDLKSLGSRPKDRSLLKKTSLIDLAAFDWPVHGPNVAAEGIDLKAASADNILQLQNDLAEWYMTVYKVKLNPRKEVYIGSGISRILFALALAFIDNGDIAFVPDLGLPLYRKVITACGGEAVGYAVSVKDDWRPNLERVGTRLGRVAHLLFVNSPHNPTGAEMTEQDFENLVWTASRENIAIVNDAAYQGFSGRKVASLMSVTGSKKVGVEVGSFAYGLGLPPFPFGYAVGHRDIISGLKEAEFLTGSFVPRAFVTLASEALRQFPSQGLQEARKHCAQSGAEARRFLESIELEPAGYDTVPFLWARSSTRKRVRRSAETLFKRARILATPGSAFGETGQGYLRLSLTAGAEAFRLATERMKKHGRLVAETEED